MSFSVTFNVYEYTVLDLDTFKTMSYAQSLGFTGRCVFLNEKEDKFVLLWDGPQRVVYLPITIKGKRLECYRTYV